MVHVGETVRHEMLLWRISLKTLVLPVAVLCENMRVYTFCSNYSSSLLLYCAALLLVVYKLKFSLGKDPKQKSQTLLFLCKLVFNDSFTFISIACTFINHISDRINRTVEIEKKYMEIEEKGVKLRLTIIDTPGFNDGLDAEQRYLALTMSYFISFTLAKCLIMKVIIVH